MDILSDIFGRMNMWAWWAIAGLILIAEVLTGTSYLLWPAAAAFLTGFVAMEMFGISWPVQLGVFAVLTLPLLWIGDRWVRPALKLGADSGLNDRSSRMIGERVTVVADFASGRGRVRYGDTEWAAESEDGSDVASGQTCTVKAVKGVVLVVA
ncbi:MAG: NfeD family protein [Alphaproteobacteria bacterium]|uniref:NfeD family protein n=1 Tax=Maricaulis alexandrii TaxID=2570354 RepID=UPI001109E0BB|nr:NfeD family protein [Maricaulis alexandrii]MCR9266934.1 NfeD family protein [Alphaproteobacteria bacterium]